MSTRAGSPLSRTATVVPRCRQRPRPKAGRSSWRSPGPRAAEASDGTSRATAAPAARAHLPVPSLRTASQTRRAATATGTAPTGASGSPDAVSATATSQASRIRLGTWRSQASRSPPRPAASPPVRPQTMIGPAAGTARAFAGIDTGARPPSVSRTGAVAAWAARVAPSVSRSTKGPGSRAASGRAQRAMPKTAATDSRKPRRCTSIGSTRISPAAARDTRRTADASTPIAPLSRARAAMAVARSTDGSQRTAVPNRPRTTSAAARRPRRPRRRSSGPAAASAKATFWPETASRWVRPAAEKSASTSAGWSRSSPTTRPAHRPRRS